ncbi:MAG: NAD(P)/FAD-dependent oxidoreductase [Coriobacteriales bacterium]|nr:NAD(P)/FAD-dependent oxidoreductase [Coriobacteriales bacterium]
MYDIAIVGAGPAGLSAAITARARNKTVLLVSNKPQDNPLAASSRVDNYPGMPGATGLHLLKCMVEHADGLGAHFVYARVIAVLPMGTHFSVTSSDAVLDARAVILAPGAQRAKPIEGEREFLGRGVSYCATCDGMLYRSATVAVVGLNAEAVAEANFLAGLGAKVVFLAPGNSRQSGTSGNLKTPEGAEGVEGAKTVEGSGAPHGLSRDIFVQEGRALAVKGGATGVTELQFLENGTRAKRSIPCQGVFILRDSIAPSALIAGLELTEGAISVDRRMRTNIEGVFAAGDCTGAPLQVAKAVGEGQLACFSAVEFLG